MLGIFGVAVFAVPAAHAEHRGRCNNIRDARIEIHRQARDLHGAQRDLHRELHYGDRREIGRARSSVQNELHDLRNSRAELQRAQFRRLNCHYTKGFSFGRYYDTSYYKRNNYHPWLGTHRDQHYKLRYQARNSGRSYYKPKKWHW